MPNFQFSRRANWPCWENILSAPQRGQKILVNQIKQTFFSYGLDKAFHLPEFQAKLFFTRNWARGFLLRQPLNYYFSGMVQIPLRTRFSFKTFILLIWLFRVYRVSGCCFSHIIIIFSIYTLSDLGDLSNLIGSLSRTIQQYSPPSEWIMCELGFFPFS